MEIKKGCPGGFVGGYLDDSLSESQVERVVRIVGELSGSIDADRFIARLRRELAEYRNLKEIAADLPGVVQDRNSARSLEATISALLSDLGEMSPRLASRVDADLLQQGHDPSEVARQSLIQTVTSGLTALQLSLLRVEMELADLPTPGRGRKKNTTRDSLLSKVTDELLSAGAPKAKTPAAAAEILTNCGVVAPQDGRSRPEKGRGKN